jgi:hypothetical protein
MSPKSSYVNNELRSLVATRADHLCEYCLIHEDDTFLGCTVDHIISLKHGGPTEAENLAYCCPFCNRHKGSDIGSISKRTGELVRFFNPRIDRWSACFALRGNIIEPLTDIGETTAAILKLNDTDRILEHEALRTIGRYPTDAALKRIRT